MNSINIWLFKTNLIKVELHATFLASDFAVVCYAVSISYLNE